MVTDARVEAVLDFDWDEGLVLFADGSVRRLSAKIDPKVFRALCTIHGAESVDMQPLGDALAEIPTK